MTAPRSPLALARAARLHLERRVLPNGANSDLFR